MNYTLRDRGYFETLKKLAEEFERQGIKYALVGGSAIQARIADIFSRATKLSIKDVPELETLLRKTKDFDVTTNSPEIDFMKFFNEIQAFNTDVHVHDESIRRKKVTLVGKTPTTVVLNYQTGPQDFFGLDQSFYNECIDTADQLNLRYNGSHAQVCVAKPEYLITSKLTRADPKDIWDIGTLLKTIEQHRDYSHKFKPSLVRDLLKRAGREEIYGRLEEIYGQILKQ